MSAPTSNSFTQDPISFITYDEVLKDFFTMKVYRNRDIESSAETIRPVTGPPRIELGTQNSLEGRDLDDEDKMNTIVRLPASALTQLNWVFDLNRWTKAEFRRLGYTEDSNRIFQSPQLIPVDVMYQLDLWSKYRVSMNQMVQNVLLKFINREVWLPIDLKGIWGTQYIPISLLYNGPENLSDLEPADKDRTVRMAFRFNFKAWIIPNAVTIPTIKKQIYQAYIAKNPDVDFPVTSPNDPPLPTWLDNWSPADEPTVIEVDKPSQNP